MASSARPSPRPTHVLALAFVLATAVLAGCGDSRRSTSPGGLAAGSRQSSNSSSQAPRGPAVAGGIAPTVFAAASLSKAFPKIDPRATYTFGGSGALEAQIEQGAPADVFAAASPKQPAALFEQGLVERPVEFATNTLVLIVPESNPAHITSVADITKPGVKLVICNVSVPCGDYARAAFENLGITAAAMHNVVSQTTDVTQTVAEVALGQADAGFVYVTDAHAAPGKVLVVRLPGKAKPQAKDYLAVVKASRHPAAARAFVAAVLSPEGQAALRAMGFGKP
ncbi:MAG: molybdate ABC transporter substrate-binding protein [Solirubrobacteraceae bacterium]